jgi:anaphase-promoting complex subunit 10
VEDGGATEKEEEGEKREIGKLAVWTVSSNKPGNGVEMLRDNNLTTYWQ